MKSRHITTKVYYTTDLEHAQTSTPRMRENMLLNILFKILFKDANPISKSWFQWGGGGGAPGLYIYEKTLQLQDTKQIILKVYKVEV